MKLGYHIMHETNKNDIVFYRVFSIIGMTAIFAFAFLYSYYYHLEYVKNSSTIFVIGVYIMFFLASFSNNKNNYVYTIAIIAIYVTSLYFIYGMVMLNFKTELILTLLIIVFVLASIFKSEIMMDIYLLSMIFISMFSILIWEPNSFEKIINIILVVSWPILIYFILKSELNEKAEMQRDRKFLEMVFNSIKEPTILISKEDLTIVNCSRSTVSKFNFKDKKSIIGLTIRDVNKEFFNDGLTEKNLFDMDTMIEDHIDFSLDILGDKKYFSIGSNEFSIEDKSYVLFSIADVTVEKKQNDAIFNLAYLDELTKIKNRRSGISELKRIIYESEKTSKIFGVFFIDVDNFKYINDEYGHDVGDQLLTIVANRLVNSTDDKDVVSRIGGDEFMIITNDLPNEDVVHSIADRIRMKINKNITIEDRVINLSISVGISMYPKHGNDYKALMKNADIALYNSKKQGRDKYNIYIE